MAEFFDLTWLPPPGIVASSYDRLALELSSLMEPLRRSVQQVIAPSIALNFEAGGRPKWEGLNIATVKQGGHSPLVRTGTLASVASSLGIWHFDMDAASVAGLPGAEYGGIHQVGTQGRRGGRGSNIPARPFMVIQPEDEEAVEAVFALWLDEHLATWGTLAI